ncbi:MAG: serine/threonine protein kinase [Okeania sp. SIO2G4]|uniref:serine/threonine protein kinase n=1 Tax=unclassified Okeania TaxID=2634635 RepID=UPI0013BBEA15|nr:MULTISPECIES: serine/threonine-protein kinase [unclassified Okeania]NEP72559.1 serine/threonine protein kinase [Okeania sp. SIO2G5]NEP95378.1 serine/threonine protein kinase [Okeania sp. SIO2F5]NEQ92955.1 serine/threonine protein kinase [Okeania sp. SIO2G4]
MTLHQPNDIIAQRYRIVTTLGKGGMGITYEAEDLTNYQRVALKAVSFQQAKDWKILELFEREAKVIANLHHPQIPKYLNYFYIDTQRDRCFYLIRELVSGNSLANWVTKGWHPTEIQVKNIAIQILKILSYLHQLNPPIIHRDIKPENIILQPDGQVFLVDFGAVKDIYRQTMSFSGTFVGTIGYMSPEQLQGKAYCASDLYSLGATLLYLLTHRSPDELPQKRMKIDISSCVKISPEFGDWLEVILEPMWEDRFQSATAALDVLCNKSEMIYSASSSVQYSHQKPEGSEVTLKKTSRSLIINIPSGSSVYIKFFVRSFFAHFFLLILTFVYRGYNDFPTYICLLNTLIMLLNIWIQSSIKADIQIFEYEFLIHCKYLAFNHKIQGKVEDTAKFKKGIILAYSHLSNREKKWLDTEINDFIEQLKFPKKTGKIRKKIIRLV